MRFLDFEDILNIDRSQAEFSRAEMQDTWPTFRQLLKLTVSPATFGLLFTIEKGQATIADSK